MGRWTRAEHEKFIQGKHFFPITGQTLNSESSWPTCLFGFAVRSLTMLGLKLYGKSWKKVEKHIGSRCGAQIRSHAQKFFIRLSKKYPKEDPLDLLLRTNFDPEIAYIGIEDEDDEIKEQAKENRSQSLLEMSDIERDIEEMR